MAEEHGASPESNTFEERDAVREGQQPGDSMQPGTQAVAGPREQWSLHTSARTHPSDDTCEMAASGAGDPPGLI